MYNIINRFSRCQQSYQLFFCKQSKGCSNNNRKFSSLVVNNSKNKLCYPNVNNFTKRFYREDVSNRVRRHIIAALVVNQPGCLAQIANLFSARGFIHIKYHVIIISILKF